MIYAATGHRPDKLGGYDIRTWRRLVAFAIEQVQQIKPTKVISGMALGWDQAVAVASYSLGIPFIAAIPFEGQACRWPLENRQRYHSILEHAEAQHIISLQFTPGAMQRRNEWMVDNADRILALWDGSWGGTFNCVQYAQKRGVPIDNAWLAWRDPDLSSLLS